jgi:TIR domain
MSRTKIFISYRRDEPRQTVRSLSKSLKREFGRGAVFVDTEAIAVGSKWPREIDQALRTAYVLLAPLGPKWLEQGQGGHRRLDDKGDWVRRELATSIKRGIPIVPLLVGGAKLPARKALPKSLAGLLDHKSFDLRDDYWNQDVAALIRSLKKLGVPTGRPKIILMDNYAKIYARNPIPGEMNSHIIRRKLQGLPVKRIAIEPVYGDWEGEKEILKRKPDLIITHYSSLGDKPRRLRRFLEEVFYKTTSTKVIIYSRTNAKPNSKLPKGFLSGMRRTFREFEGRIYRLPVYRGHQTFDDPLTSGALRALVKKVLGFDD